MGDPAVQHPQVATHTGWVLGVGAVGVTCVPVCKPSVMALVCSQRPHWGGTVSLRLPTMVVLLGGSASLYSLALVETPLSRALVSTQHL